MLPYSPWKCRLSPSTWFLGTVTFLAWPLLSVKTASFCHLPFSRYSPMANIFLKFGRILRSHCKCIGLMPIQATELRATIEANLRRVSPDTVRIHRTLFAPKHGVSWHSRVPHLSGSGRIVSTQFTINWGGFHPLSEGAVDLCLQSLRGCSVRDNRGPSKELRGQWYFPTISIGIRGLVWGEWFLLSAVCKQGGFLRFGSKVERVDWRRRFTPSWRLFAQSKGGRQFDPLTPSFHCLR